MPDRPSSECSARHLGPKEAPRHAESLALYIHWPFCLSKCPYCDFNSHVRPEIDQTLWRSALLRELRTEAGGHPDSLITSIFFGGGTPSLMAPETVRLLIEEVSRRWARDKNVEITLEANPTSVETTKLKDFRLAGVNRLSLGVQSLQDDALKYLGREHTAREALQAVEKAHNVFQRYSFDLMYCRPNQSVDDWERELTTALTYVDDHISLYQLTIERGTDFFARWRKGDIQLPDDDTAVLQYERTQQILENAGMPAYEISNHSTPGGECRHNLSYWRYNDYLGIGPGAHGRVRRGGKKWAVRRISNPENWRLQVEKQGDGIQENVALTNSEIFEEMVLMGLRLRNGIKLKDIGRQTGERFEDQVNQTALGELISSGFLEHKNRTLVATDSGLQRLNGVISHLLN